MKNKVIAIIMIFTLMMTWFTTIAFAAEETTVKTKKDVILKKVSDNVCKISIGEDGELVKKLISVDDTKKEVILQIDVTNNKSREFEEIDSEVILVVDNSKSMRENNIGDKTRQEVVYNATKNLAASLLNASQNVTIGLVQFSTNTNFEKEGTIEDARLLLQPTSNGAQIENAINSIVTDGPRTNIDAGLQVAKNAFTSKNNNKYLILLTDGAPNTAVGGPTIVYNDEVVNKTKATLNTINESNINLITVMTGVTNDPIYGEGETYKDYVEKIFLGSDGKPLYGKFHYVTDSNVERTITQDVYSDVVVPIENKITNIVIKDYFPADIINNYDYEPIGQANIGTVSSLNKADNSFTWTIPELGPKQTATLKYKLVLKDNFDNKIIDKITPTNEKVDVTYKDSKGEDGRNTSNVSPTIVLVAIEEPEPEPEPPKPEPEPQKPDPTVIPTPTLVQTGDKIFTFLSVITALGSIGVYSLYKYKKI